MINFKRILFPVDFSAQSQAVVPFVRAMAKCFDSEIVILHVVDIPDSWHRSAEPGGESRLLDIDRLHVEGTTALDRFVAREFPSARVRPQVTKGDAARQIVDCAHKQQADLIMIPTHGYGPFRALLLGSVTAKVLHDVHCPVWTGVHAEQMTSHSPDRWKRVLCAVETDEHGESVLKWAWQFAQQQSLELQLVHAVAGADGMWTAENDPSMYEFLFHAAREQLAKLQAGARTNLDIRLVGGSVGSAVHKAALGYDADLIVIGRGAIQTSLGRLKNSTYSIIRAAPCPVISI
jgi:nucleotide-binding universal stress UspA family protein